MYTLSNISHVMDIQVFFPPFVVCTLPMFFFMVHSSVQNSRVTVFSTICTAFKGHLLTNPSVHCTVQLFKPLDEKMCYKHCCSVPSIFLYFEIKNDLACFCVIRQIGRQMHFYKYTDIKTDRQIGRQSVICSNIRGYCVLSDNLQVTMYNSRDKPYPIILRPYVKRLC